MQLPESIQHLIEQSTPSCPLYLVGGAVRDSLLSRDCKDFDFVTRAKTRQLAKEFANFHGASFYALDGERETYRVIIRSQTGDKTKVDFAAQRGEDIYEDLLQRDFTLNAMALALHSLEVIIDPFKGGRDLQQRWLRPVSPVSLSADPLRIFRAIRYSVDLGLKIEQKTVGLISAAVPGLREISAERKRDELFKILSGRNIFVALQLLQKFNLFMQIQLTIKPDISTMITRVRKLEDVLDWLCHGRKLNKQAAFYQSALYSVMGKYQGELKEHFYSQNNSERLRKGLLFLSAILQDHEGLAEQLSALRLSVNEIQIIMNIMKNTGVASDLLKQDHQIAPLDIYHFFNNAGSAGLDLVVLSLVEEDDPITQDHWLWLLKRCDTLVDAWFNHPEIVSPIPLLNGNELIQSFSLKEGPQIGQLLELMKTKQVEGTLKTKDEALQWAALFLNASN